MSDLSVRIAAFVEYASTLSGDEGGEAQVICDRLFRAFGHQGYKEVGARRRAAAPTVRGRRGVERSIVSTFKPGVLR